MGRLRGVDAAMVFEVEFVFPSGDAKRAVCGGRRCVAFGDRVVVPGGGVRVEVFFYAGEVVLRGVVAHGWDGFFIFTPGGDPVVSLVEHGSGGAAAVIADAVEVEHLGGAGVAVGGLGEVGGDAGGVYVVVDVVGGEVG